MGKEKNTASHIVRLADAAKRILSVHGRKFRKHFFVRHELIIKRRGNHRWSDCVHSNPVGCELLSEISREHVEACFRGRKCARLNMR